MIIVTIFDKVIYIWITCWFHWYISIRGAFCLRLSG